MFERLVRHRRDVKATDHRCDARGTEAIGKRVTLLHLRGVGGERHEIARRQRIHVFDVVHFVVVDVMAVVSERGERQESEARERRDRRATLDESGKAEAKSGQLRIVGADTRHGNEGDPHHASLPQTYRTLPERR